MLKDATDPGVRGTINPARDQIIFREPQLSLRKIQRYRPFNQVLSDAEQPIRVVVGSNNEKYMMQGNHRIRSAQMDGIQAVEGILYTPEQWEAFTGWPFQPGGTNNPLLGP